MKKIFFILFISSFAYVSCNDEITTNDTSKEFMKSNYNLSSDEYYRYPENNDCEYKCSGEGSECSVWNPGVCGSICQLRTAANIFGIKNETKNLSTNLLNFFPTLYELRDTLGLELVDKYYELGDLYLSGLVEISVENQKMIVLEILNKSTLILEFVNNKNSNSVLLNTYEVNDYLQMINNLRQDSVNPDYQEILNYFEDRIKDIENKTIYEIYNLL
ncbi:MAG: hypothetical protein ACK5M1_02100 [Xanthomarina gelatinilytica]|uniref:hypothetical protein n=1 Tax=Xanthomarina gelatinilytica TaxID=1137281 RepID=UPI003A868EA1